MPISTPALFQLKFSAIQYYKIACIHYNIIIGILVCFQLYNNPQELTSQNSHEIVPDMWSWNRLLSYTAWNR